MGPLSGIRVIEVAGLGPGPFAGMMLADMGAEVIQVDRHGGEMIPRTSDISARGKKSIVLDLKSPEGLEILLKLVAQADGLFEGFRPGVAEKLGFGPDVCLQQNPKLVYGRMTGWGQDGPLAKTAGHDINYIALSGALQSIGRADGSPPVAPLNLVGDYGGGGMMLAFGMVCALLEARTSGRGQVVDTSMVEGSSLLMTVFHSLMHAGGWQQERGTNMLDSGAPYYDCYETLDGKYISLGAIEPQFYEQFLTLVGLDRDLFGHQNDQKRWPLMKSALTDIFRSKSQANWCALLEGTDVCFAPVMGFWEAADHPHNKARNSFLEMDGLVQPAPCPKFSRTAPAVRHSPHAKGADGDSILTDAGLTLDEIGRYREKGVIG